MFVIVWFSIKNKKRKIQIPTISNISLYKNNSSFYNYFKQIIKNFHHWKYIL